MPLLVKLPKTDRHLNVLSRKKTAVQRELRRGGLAGYEPETQAVLYALCSERRGLTVYDVGAHIGIFAAILEVLFAADCIAFEPTPETVKLCHEFKLANGLKFGIVPAGVAANEGEAELYLSTRAETSNSFNGDFRPGSPSIRVPITTVDAYVAAGGPIPAILKIDAESCDPEVILGSEETIKSARPAIVCEMLNKTDRARAGEALRMLTHSGYFLYHLHSRTPWIPITVDQALSIMGSSAPAWAFLPERPTRDLYLAMEEWAEAIHECGPDTNIIRAPKILS